MKYVLLVVVSTVVSAQLLMFSSRRKPLATRFRDLSEGGDVFTLGGAALLMCGSVGALAGHLLAAAPSTGAAAGLVLALVATTATVIWAHRRPRPAPRHRDQEANG